MRRGPSGKVVCCICRKWLDGSEAVGINGRHAHLDHCFAAALARIGKALAVNDFLNFAVSAAFKAGQGAR